jgi:hypothetical protein
MKHFLPKIGLAVLALLASSLTKAQDAAATAGNWMREHHEALGLDAMDARNIQVTDLTTDKRGVGHVYIRQVVHGLPVYGAVANFTVKDGRVIHVGNRLQHDVAGRVAGAKPALRAEDALCAAAKDLGLTPGAITVQQQISRSKLVLGKSGISREPIPATLIYQWLPGQQAIPLAWELVVRETDGAHWWRITVDAHNGKVLQRNDRMVHCAVPAFGRDRSTASASELLRAAAPMAAAPPPPDGASYRVYAFPVESPTFGPQVVVTDPADPTASPFGWHDTDGQAGAEYTITRGNNVYAGEDIDDDDIIGYSPDGGPSLTFDQAYAPPQAPDEYLDAAITNLFYACNTLHDVWYQYGFDEQSGNFQETNYSGLGEGEDAVYAQAQDGSGTNNANFGTPPDGGSGAMQMYLWTTTDEGDSFTVNSPGSVAGTYSIEIAGFGPELPSDPITADLVLVEDDADPFTDACDNLVNGADIAGKIAVVDRGLCTFVSKVEQIEAAGALAVVVINNVGGGTITMGGNDGGAIGIPSVMISLADGQALKNAMAQGPVNATLQGIPGTTLRDADFDNGIIAHEYGHGVSIRLTGGASNVDCLDNDEQMGEGWSDWMGMVLTMQAGDEGGTPRGVGNFVLDEGTDGVGIRPAPYSTDFSVNPYTYGATTSWAFQETHGLGFIWATILWEATWDLINAEGFDPDLFHGTGGNNIAMQLVMDGLKLQPCSPGFVDGRDAILLADSLDYGGEHACLLWHAFARRGLGYSASQGSSFSVNDQVEAFDVPPACATSGVPETNGLPSGFVLAPDPAHGSVLLKLPAPLPAGGAVRLLGMDGRIQREVRFNGGLECTIDLHGLAAGVYMVQLDVAGKRLQQRLVVE